VKLSRRASYQRDLNAPVDYIAQDNPPAALDMLDRIEQYTERLRQHPGMGRPGRVKSTRELVVPGTPYIVVYRLTKTEAVLLRVLHGVQQWPPTSR
jgi:toxin ParE1/3/4